MKQTRLSEVRALLASDAFRQWWGQLVAARTALGDAEERHEELLAQSNLMEFRAELTQKNAIDTLYRAGEHEDTAANMLVTSTELENRAFQGVSNFEEQRFRVSELWYRLGAAEKKLEEAKPDERASTERLLRVANDEYTRENVRKDRLWEEVETLWAKGAEESLLLAEQRMLGKKVRKEAEGLFALADERKKKSKRLRVETDDAAHAVEAARAQVATLLGSARDRFSCAAGTEFLYFRLKDDSRQAFAVALVSDSDSYNIEIVALGLYSVDRQRGVAFLEPARHTPPSAEEGDRRFDDYFLTGRKREPRV